MKRLSLFALMLLVLMLILPTLAQDATTEPSTTAPIAEATAPTEGQPNTTVINAEGNVTLNQNPNETAQPTANDATVTLSIWQILAGLFAAVALGGIGGIAGAGVIAVRLMNNQATMKAIEDLGNSVPQKHADQVLSFATGFQAIVADFKGSLDAVVLLTQKALDHVPESEKQVKVPPIPTETLPLP